MNKPKLLLIGYRAFGDWLYALPSLDYLFKHYDIHLETNRKGWHLLGDDPRFASKTLFDPWDYPEEEHLQVCKERWDALEKEIKPDKTINLWRTLETECIAERYQDEFFLPVDDRRDIFGKKNFYEAVLSRCDVPTDYPIKLDGMFFTEYQKEWGKRFKEKHKEDFVVLMVVAGSCSHKVYPSMPRLSYELLDKHPNMKIYLMGDETIKDAQWEHPRIIPTSGKAPFKQAIMMAKHSDFVLGGETGLLVAAGMFGTPKIMLCTSCNTYQACKYHINDFSIQSSTKCSPCHRAVYTIHDCEDMIKVDEDTYYPRCISGFDYEYIRDTIGDAYDNAM